MNDLRTAVGEFYDAALRQRDEMLRAAELLEVDPSTAVDGINAASGRDLTTIYRKALAAAIHTPFVAMKLEAARAAQDRLIGECPTEITMQELLEWHAPAFTALGDSVAGLATVRLLATVPKMCSAHVIVGVSKATIDKRLSLCRAKGLLVPTPVEEVQGGATTYEFQEFRSWFLSQKFRNGTIAPEAEARQLLGA